MSSQSSTENLFLASAGNSNGEILEAHQHRVDHPPGDNVLIQGDVLKVLPTLARFKCLIMDPLGGRKTAISARRKEAVYHLIIGMTSLGSPATAKSVVLGIRRN